MKINTDYPHKIREIENTWIPMPDGARLAARLWLPEDAEAHPVPAVLEYIPYRKDDGTAVFDSRRHPYLAGHGYASVRVDMRGSGDSDGILYDEYLPQEQLDAVEVIAWLAKQPWCTGAVGMYGISWGGFNCLQVAAHRPPALKAIISVASTDDRYADDVHYMGGALLNMYMLSWASTMFAYNARPPQPHLAGERWREMWLERMEKTPPFIEAWVGHQRRDEFWKQGSVCETYRRPAGPSLPAITCAVYAVGGWADGYRNTVFRLLEGLQCPKKGLVGPWSHIYPHFGTPGPLMGFMQESLRWWDHWLKGLDTGIMDEPALRAWVQDSVPPRTQYLERPGHWVTEPSWPSPNIEPLNYHLNASGTLAETPEAETPVSFCSPASNGIYSGSWCPFGLPGDFPPDQREEDGQSVCFDTLPAAEPVEILGYPEVTLTLASDRPLALVALRLCDVAPDGASLFVTRGMLNLTHRESHEHPSPLEPGRRYTVTVRLNSVAHTLPSGHKWRLAVSSNYWPHLWPSPEPVTLTLYAGDPCRLALPARPPRPEDAGIPPFEPAEGSEPLALETLRMKDRRLNIDRDLVTGRVQYIDRSDNGWTRQVATGIEYGAASLDEHKVLEGDPLSAVTRCERTVTVGRGEWRTRIETISTMTGDAHDFHLNNVLDAYEGDTRVFTKTWTKTVPRDFV
jgi:putative CocE/NonD family hydrolase